VRFHHIIALSTVLAFLPALHMELQAWKAKRLVERRWEAFQARYGAWEGRWAFALPSGEREELVVSPSPITVKGAERLLEARKDALLLSRVDAESIFTLLHRLLVESYGRDCFRVKEGRVSVTKSDWVWARAAEGRSLKGCLQCNSVAVAVASLYALLHTDTALSLVGLQKGPFLHVVVVAGGDTLSTAPGDGRLEGWRPLPGGKLSR